MLKLKQKVLTQSVAFYIYPHCYHLYNSAYIMYALCNVVSEVHVGGTQTHVTYSHEQNMHFCGVNINNTSTFDC